MCGTYIGLCAMLTLPANQKARSAQGAKRKAAPGKRKGKVKKPRHANRVANPGPATMILPAESKAL